MASLQRIVSRSLAARGSQEGLQTRLEEIAQVQNPAKRSILQAIHGVTIAHPVAAGAAVGRRPRRDLKPVGVGWHAEVYSTHAESVLKVATDSDKLTEKQRIEKAARLRFEHEALRDYLGDIVVPHEITVGRHPHFLGKRAILMDQAYHDIRGVTLHEESGNMSVLQSRIQLELLPRDNGERLQVITDLSKNGQRLFEDTGLSADIVGHCNVGVDKKSEALLMVDAQPYGPSDIFDETSITPAQINKYVVALGVAAENIAQQRAA